MFKHDQSSLRIAGPPDPVVVRALARPVLERLRRHGAASVAELREAGIEFSGVPLDPEEIELSLDSARRLALITCWDVPTRPDGHPSSALEWALSRSGASEMTSVESMISRLGSWLGAGLRTVTPLVALLGLAGALRGFHPPPAIVLGPVYTVLVWAVLWWIPRHGASPTTLVAGWPRLRRDHPEVAERLLADEELMRRVGFAAPGLLLLIVLLGLWRHHPAPVVALVLVGYAGLVAYLLEGWRRSARANEEVKRSRTGGEFTQLTLDITC